MNESRGERENGEEGMEMGMGDGDGDGCERERREVMMEMRRFEM